MIPLPIPTPSPKEIWDYIRYITDWMHKQQYKRLVELQVQARNDSRLYDYLGWLYENIVFHYKGLTFPVALFPASKRQRYDLESVLGELDTDLNDEIDRIFEQVGQGYLKKLREAPASPWDDPTYRMTKFEFNDQLKLTCALGGYYNMLKSCDILEFELLTEFGKQPPVPSTFPSFTSQLKLRNYHHRKGNPIEAPLGRSVAISISTLIIFAEGGTFKTFVRERSEKVAVAQNLLHIIPSFMFQPVLRWYHEEYSVRHNIYREYLEEVLAHGEVERPDGEYGFDFFYENDNLRYLRDLEEEGKARFYFTGVAMNLLSLRPEICTLLLITDPEWIVNQRRGRRVNGYELDVIRINWEFKGRDELRGARFERIASIDLTKDLLMPDGLFKPENFVPFGAGGLKLGIDVAREELGIEPVWNDRRP